MVDFSILHSNTIPVKSESIRIRTKHAAFVVDPAKSIVKSNADAVILLGKETPTLDRVSNYRVVLNGEGEYEIDRVKISSIARGDGFVYSIFADNIEIILARISTISKAQDKSLSSQVAVFNVDDELNSIIASIIAKLEPRVVVLYGDKKLEGAKELGREGIKPIQKFTFTKEKLGEEMEVVVLG